MLTAEATALEHETRRQLLEIRQAEIAQMVSYFQAVGTQSALIAGFVITLFTATIDADFPPATSLLGQAAEATCWISSALALSCCAHTLLNSTFAGVWGPGLALRGPIGSVSKAFFGMRVAARHIGRAYRGSLVCFIFECLSAYVLLEERETRHINLWWTPYASVAILVAGMTVSAKFYKDIESLLYFGGTGDKSLGWDADSSGLEERNFDREDRTLFRRNEDEKIHHNESDALLPKFGVSGAMSAFFRRSGAKPTMIHHEGWLERRRFLVWERRYFVLEGSTLYHWKSEEAAVKAREENPTGPWEGADETLDLSQPFHVLVCRNARAPYEFILQLPPKGSESSTSVSSKEDEDDTKSIASSFAGQSVYGTSGTSTASAVGGKLRNKHFRTDKEDVRVAWVRLMMMLSDKSGLAK